MKKLLLALLLVPKFASASYLGLYPYFRPLSIGHLQPVGGALIDVKDVQQSEMTGLLPVFTHSPLDGCLLPSVVCEDWTPLAVGFSAIAGHFEFIAAPLFNILPIMQVAALKATPDSLPGLQKVLGSNSNAVTFSGGPAWEYKSETNKGYLRVFTGLALHF